jgi:hypothetical protein
LRRASRDALAPEVDKRFFTKLVEAKRKPGETTEVKAYGFFAYYRPDRGEQRLIALRHGSAIGVDKSEATVCVKAARAERSAFQRDGAAAFHRVGVEFFDQH